MHAAVLHLVGHTHGATPWAKGWCGLGAMGGLGSDRVLVHPPRVRLLSVRPANRRWSAHSNNAWVPVGQPTTLLEKTVLRTALSPWLLATTWSHCVSLCLNPVTSHLSCMSSVGRHHPSHRRTRAAPACRKWW